MRRDGIAPGPGAGRSQLADLDHFMVEVLAGTPLCAWTDAFGRTAEQILAVPAGDWAPVLFAGWSRAAIAQRDQDWMAALISRALADGPPSRRRRRDAAQLARRADPSLGAPVPASPGADAPPAVRNALNVLRFRHDMLKELEDGHSDG